MSDRIQRPGRVLPLAALLLIAACKPQGPGSMPGGSALSPGVQASAGTSAETGASPDGGVAAARSTTDPSLSPTIPPDIPPRPTSHMTVNEFSWQMFVAMNWPAAPDQRGAPDTTKTIGQDGPTV